MEKKPDVPETASNQTHSSPIFSPPKQTSPAPPKILHVPEVNHKVLVLIDEKGGLSPSDAIFLKKVLEAVKITPEHTDILNVADFGQIDFRPVLTSKKVHHVISFGVPFLKVNLEILMNRYEPKKADGVCFLFSETLAIVQADDRNKRALWNALKALFF